MKYRYLDDYHQFVCIADKCPATCCSGWAVEIDEESLEKYEVLANQKQDELLKKNIDWSESCFTQKGNGGCSFLKENGLCQLYLNYGEGIFCKTCDLYPRHMEEFPNVREYSLSVSCPVVAKQLLEKAEQLKITEEEHPECNDDLSEYEDFDETTYQILVRCREQVINILQSREESLEKRSELILQFMRLIQEEVDLGMAKEIDTDAILEELSDNIYKYKADKNGSDGRSAIFSNRMEAFQLLFELEPLQDSFRKFLDTSKAVLVENSLQELTEGFEKNYPEWETWCEQLSVYFIFTYMCGAIYDEYIYAMTAQAVYNASMIKLLWTVAFYEKGNALSMDELAKIVYQYSRELEHSNENMILLEQLLEEFS